MNLAIRLLAALVGAGLVGIGVWDGLENSMPEVDPIDLVQAGAFLIGVAAVPRLDLLWPGTGSSKEREDG